MFRSSITLIFLSLLFACENSSQPTEMIPPVIAPFTDVDSLAINDWWNRGENEIINLDVDRDSVVAFGIYMVANNTLNLTAQLFPLYPEESREVTLSIKEDGNWKEIQKQKR